MSFNADPSKQAQEIIFSWKVNKSLDLLLFFNKLDHGLFKKIIDSAIIFILWGDTKKKRDLEPFCRVFHLNILQAFWF